MGGGMSIGPGALSPFIKLMLIANLGIYILQNMWPELTYLAGLTPSRFFSEFPNLIYQPLTYMFLHGGFGHILFNMFALWMFGTEIEFSWGSKSFGRFYLLGGLSGAVLTLMVNPEQSVPMVGASAAIYGILIAYWLMFPQRMLYIYMVVPVKVKYAIPGMMLLGLLFAGASTANMAHLGGAIFGFVYLKANLRLLKFGSGLNNLRYRRKTAKLAKKRQQADDVMKRVDIILDKINEIGIENLSKSERKFLEEASTKLSDEKLEDRQEYQ